MAMQWTLMILAITAMLFKLTMAATYTVGSPNGGWDTSTDLQTWASTQSFLVGDNLIFQYTPNHDVLEVTKGEYDSCQASNPIRSDNSGTTTIPLSSPGKRYFICGITGHCGQGMKVEIDTLATSPVTPPPAASPVSPPVSSPSPEAFTPSPTESPFSAPTMTPSQSESPISSPSTFKTFPSTESPAISPPPSGLISPPPPSSAHKCSFQATLAMGVGFVMVFLAL